MRRGRPPIIEVPDDGPRIIKRYKNRRLYDSRAAQYINQSELLGIADREEVRVLEATTGCDLTSAILGDALCDCIIWDASTLKRLWKIYRGQAR